MILLCIRWYLAHSLSYRDLQEMMAERGLKVDASTLYRWVQAYAPELDHRICKQLKPTNARWNVYETYIRVKGAWVTPMALDLRFNVSLFSGWAWIIGHFLSRGRNMFRGVLWCRWLWRRGWRYVFRLL